MSIQKRIYALNIGEILLNVTCFDANNEHYMDFVHIVKRNDTFEVISQKIQERLLHKTDQKFDFMHMVYNHHVLDGNNTPSEFNMKSSDILIVVCKYLFQRDSFYDYFLSI